MRIVIEDTNPSNDNKQKGITESEKDSESIDQTLHLVVKALMAYGYRSDDIKTWFVQLANKYKEESNE